MLSVLFQLIINCSSFFFFSFFVLFPSLFEYFIDLSVVIMVKFVYILLCRLYELDVYSISVSF